MFFVVFLARLALKNSRAEERDFLLDLRTVQMFLLLSHSVSSALLLASLCLKKRVQRSLSSWCWFVGMSELRTIMELEASGLPLIVGFVVRLTAAALW